MMIAGRTARIRAALPVLLEYPRHRDNPELVRLRHDVPS